MAMETGIERQEFIEAFLRENEHEEYTADELAEEMDVTREQVQQDVSVLRRDKGVRIHIVGHSRYMYDDRVPLTFRNRKSTKKVNIRKVKNDHKLQEGMVLEVVRNLKDGKLLLECEQGRLYRIHDMDLID